MSCDRIFQRRRRRNWILAIVIAGLAFVAFLPNLDSYKIESRSTVRVNDETTVDAERVRYLGEIMAGDKVGNLCTVGFRDIAEYVSRRDDTAIANTARLGLPGGGPATCVPVSDYYDDGDQLGKPRIVVDTVSPDAATLSIQINEGYLKEISLFFSGILGAAAVGFLIEATKPRVEERGGGEAAVRSEAGANQTDKPTNDARRANEEQQADDVR